MKKIIVILAMIILTSNTIYSKQLWGLMTEFKTEDLIKVNAWNQIGKKDINNYWGLMERNTGSMEIGYIVGILDTEDPNKKIVGFFYEKTNTYKEEYPPKNLYFYAFSLMDNLKPYVKSIGMDYHPFLIDNNYNN